MEKNFYYKKIKRVNKNFIIKQITKNESFFTNNFN